MGDAPRIFGLLAAGLLAATQLGGCARTGPPAPVEVKGQQDHRRPAASAPAPASIPGAVVVGRGDTLYAIARQHNIPTRAIIDANGLQPPYALRVGQRLTLPSVRTHVVQPGDTVNNLARRYNIEMSSLVRSNAIQPPYRIMVGQSLILPASEVASPEVQVARGSDPSPPVGAAPPAVPATPVESAPLAAPAATGSAAVAPPARPAASAPTAVAPAAPAPAPQPSAAHSEPAAAPSVAPPTPAQQAAAVEPAAASLPARAGRGFQWPVRGRVISDYGPKGGGLQNDGINIAAARGAPIRAAEHGVVVYAGNELRGFGNLLLLRHADGWMTAYGHADEILVARGDEVKRGQVVARVGATGNVTSPQVHFEIRRGARAVNPREHLVSETASSN